MDFTHYGLSSNIGHDTTMDIGEPTMETKWLWKSWNDKKNNIEKAMVMEPAFAKEIMMFVDMKHWNVKWFVGAYQKPLI
jgi:hypothetical protein